MSTTRQGALARTLPNERLNWRVAMWENRWLGAGAVGGLGALTALVSSVPMPRGPVTGGQGLTVIAVSLLIGLAAGYVMRSKWAIVIAPLAYIAAYELARFGIRGASLEALRFDSVYGIAAFLTGRGFHAVLAVLPMLVGAGIGVALAQRGRRERSRRRAIVALLPPGSSRWRSSDWRCWSRCRPRRHRSLARAANRCPAASPS